MEKKDLKKVAFMNALKGVTEKVPLSDSDNKAKRVIALSIKEAGVSISETLDYISSLCNIRESFSDKEWMNIVNYHKNWNGELGKMLLNFKKVSVAQFSTLAQGCGIDSELLLKENKIDEFGWMKVLDTLKEECNDMTDCPETVLVTSEKEVVPPMPVEMGKTISKKTIVMKNEDGLVVGEFKTAVEAAEKTDICRCSISKSLNNNPGCYKYLLSKKDGNKYTFEYKESIIYVPIKSVRKYNRSKIVVINLDTKEETTYENAQKAALALGVKYDDIYGRANGKNHILNGKYEVWREIDYNNTIAPAAA